MSELVSEYVEFNVPHNNVGHFGDESFQAIDCTDADNQINNTQKIQNN